MGRNERLFSSDLLAWLRTQVAVLDPQILIAPGSEALAPVASEAEIFGGSAHRVRRSSFRGMSYARCVLYFSLFYSP